MYHNQSNISQHYLIAVAFGTVSEFSSMLERMLQQCLVTKSKVTGINREASHSAFFKLSSSKDNLTALTALTGSHQLTVWLALNVFELLLNQATESGHDASATMTEPLASEEADIVHYIGGFVIKKLSERCHSTEQRDILTSFVADSQAEPNTLLAAKSHGKLTNISSEARCMFVELEQVFKETVRPSIVNPSGNKACFLKACESNKVIQDCFYNSTYGEEHSQLKDEVFFDIISLYFTVRIHHKCKIIVDRVRARNKVSSKEKALRSKLAK